SYVPSPLQANYLIQEEHILVFEEKCLLPPILNPVLDEWVERHKKIDPHAEELEAYENGLGTYYIFEEEVVLPHMLKKSEENPSLWKLYFDGSRSRNGVGRGVLLISHKDEKLFFTHGLHFTCDNN
ncbi:hypothetical protein KI387_006414, partial [Taxus chinensis]